MRAAPHELTAPGWVIVGAVAVLLGVGIASIYVTDTHYALGDDGPRNAAKQCLRLVVSLAVGAVILTVGYQRIARHAYVIFALALALLVPLVVAHELGTTFGGLMRPRNGAYRWIQLPGFPLQPSELMKVAYILALAWYLRHRANYRRLGGLLRPMVITAIPAVLILREPDLGTVILVVALLFVMLFIAGAKVWHLVIMACVGLAAVPLAWGRMRDYQRLRITAVLLQSASLRRAVIEAPERFTVLASKRQAVEWAASAGYQLVHSKNAIGSGGLTGCGWGQGIYVENDWLPDRHNDFIFAVIGHQWGFAGCVIVLLCYAAIVTCGVAVASATTEPVGRLLAVGVVTLIAAEVLINTAMTVGLMPITGMSLPFVSYGGSGLLTNFVAIALLISVSQHRPFVLYPKPFEFHARKTDVDPIVWAEDVRRAERLHDDAPSRSDPGHREPDRDIRAPSSRR
ncbi:MAG: FtsW/RodA/SpoVE family cell cycle protein [Phycisphaerae bacterium]